MNEPVRDAEGQSTEVGYRDNKTGVVYREIGYMDDYTTVERTVMYGEWHDVVKGSVDRGE